MGLKLRTTPRFLASIYSGTNTTVRKDGLATYIDVDFSDLILNSLPDYGYTGTLGSLIVLQEAPAIHTPNILGPSGVAGGYFLMDGNLFGGHLTNYHIIYDSSAGLGLQIGNTTDPTNYYNNTSHVFRTRAFGAIASITLSGSDAVLTATATNGSLKLVPNGTGVVDISKGSLSGGRLVKGIYILAASNVAGSAKTGDTLESTLATIQVPANSMGANGTLRITVTARCTGTAGTKTLRVKFGGTSFSETANGTTILSVRNAAHVSNRNATNSQVGMGLGSTGYGGSANDVTTGAIDTTANQDITITGQLSNAGDSIAIAQYLVELIVP